MRFNYEHIFSAYFDRCVYILKLIVNCSQVDITPDVASKVSQKCQILYTSKRHVSRESKDPHIFDEAYTMVMKELLPFWGGFVKLHAFSENIEMRGFPFKCK